MIRHEDGKYCLYSSDGSERLGCHDTEAEAMGQEHAIQANKGAVVLSRAVVKALCPGCADRMAALGLRELRIGPDTLPEIRKALRLDDPAVLAGLGAALRLQKQGNVDALISWARGVGYEECVTALKDHPEDIDNPYATCHWLIGKAAPASKLPAASPERPSLLRNLVQILGRGLGWAPDVMAKMEGDAVSFDEALARRRLYEVNGAYSELVGALWEAIETAVFDPAVDTAAAIRSAVDDFAGRATDELVTALSSAEKAGRKIAGHRLERLKKLRTTLGAWRTMLAQLIDEVEATPATKRTGLLLKADPEQRLVFGLFNLAVNADGETIPQEGIDGYTDLFSPEVIEKAAYAFVLDYREGGVMHERGAAARLVESVVFTPEKLAKLGLPVDALPEGAWWGGFRVDDDEVWERIKSGELRMFSIQGRAEREAMA